MSNEIALALWGFIYGAVPRRVHFHLIADMLISHECEINRDESKCFCYSDKRCVFAPINTSKEIISITFSG